MRFPSLLIPFICLALSAQPEPRWERVPADLSAIQLPPLLRIARYDFIISFSAVIQNRRFTDICDIQGPPQLVPKWAQHNLRRVKLGAKARKTTGQFRLRMNILDPHIEQKVLSQ